MVKKSKKSLKGGMVRAGSVQHFRRGKGIYKKRKISSKRLKGGMVRSGSVQHLRNKQKGGQFSFMKSNKSKQIDKLKKKLVY